MVLVEVDQDHRDDLRMFIAQQLGNRCAVHPFQAFDTGNVAALQDAVEQDGGLFIAQRALEHGPDIFIVVGNQRALIARQFGEAVDHLVDAFARDRLQARDGFTQPLHFFR